MVSNIPGHSGHRGFTLIELLVTISIAAILATIALPSFFDVIQRNRISTTAGSLQADFAYARSEAVRRGSSVSVCPADVSEGSSTTRCNDKSDWTAGWIVFTDTNGDGKVDTSETVLRQRLPEKGMTVSPTSGSVASAKFVRALPTGEYSTSGVIRICSNGFKGMEISVNLGGNIRAKTTTSICS